jgi:hypothetical protein
MDCDQQTPQIENGALETRVPCFGIPAAGVAKFEPGQRSVIFQRLPDDSSVVTDTACAIKRREGNGPASARRFEPDSAGFIFEQKFELGIPDRKKRYHTCLYGRTG